MHVCNGHSYLVLVVAHIAASPPLLANVVVVHKLQSAETVEYEVRRCGDARCAGRRETSEATRSDLLELVFWTRRVRHRPLETDIAVYFVEVLPQLRKPHRLEPRRAVGTSQGGTPKLHPKPCSQASWRDNILEKGFLFPYSEQFEVGAYV